MGNSMVPLQSSLFAMRQSVTLAFATYGAWKSKQNMPPPARALLSATTINERGYIMGGYDIRIWFRDLFFPQFDAPDPFEFRDTDELSPVLDVWTSKMDMITTRQFWGGKNGFFDAGRMATTSMTIGDLGYTLGGKVFPKIISANPGFPDPTPQHKGWAYSDNDSFNPIENTWTHIGDIPGGFGRESMSSFVINGMGYLCGGIAYPPDNVIKPSGNILVFPLSIDVYDVDENIWASRTDNIAAYTGDPGMVLNANGYILGSPVTKYNPITDAWDIKTTEPNRNSESSGSPMINVGYVYGGRFPGHTQRPNGVSDSSTGCAAYLPVVDGWKTIEAMLEPGRSFSAASSMYNKGYVYGGMFTKRDVDEPYDDIVTFLQDCDEFTPSV